MQEKALVSEPLSSSPLGAYVVRPAYAYQWTSMDYLHFAQRLEQRMLPGAARREVRACARFETLFMPDTDETSELDDFETLDEIPEEDESDPA